MSSNDHHKFIKPEGHNNQNNDEFIDNCYMYLIHCIENNQLLIKYSMNFQIIWLPFIMESSLSLINDSDWDNDYVVDGTIMILSNAMIDNDKKISKNSIKIKHSNCMEIFRLQSPVTLKFITRITYYVQLSFDDFKYFSNKNYKWIDLNQLLINSEYRDKIWGPELLEFCQQILQKNLNETIKEYPVDKALYFKPKNQNQAINLEEFILYSANLTDKIIEQFYIDYINYCYPSIYQTFISFKFFLQRYGFNLNENLLKLFNSFIVVIKGKKFLTFHELLLGIALIEPTTIHNEYRCNFIYRYYSNGSSRDSLNQNELINILNDLNYDKNQINDLFKKINFSHNEINLKKFMELISSRLLIGTSRLCRTSRSLFKQLQQKNLMKKFQQNDYNDYHYQEIMLINDCDCVRMKKNYKLSKHLVKITNANDTNEILIDDCQLINDNDIDIEDNYSIEIQLNFQSSASTILMQLIHNYYNSNEKGDKNRPIGLLHNNHQLLLSLSMAIFDLMKKLLSIESSKIVEIESPCFIIGDIHGNLDDLLYMERCIWKNFLNNCFGANLLFLGDYVDRGHWSVECCLYLFSLKINCPNKVTLLRGNHEVRSLQLHYTFKKELLYKYGNHIGNLLWTHINDIFDMLPISAIIDQKIFCSHGGISRTSNNLNEIKTKIPPILNDPEHQSKIVWEILWSDPCTNQQFLELCNFYDINDINQTKGFLSNVKRGTAYQFNEQALDRFFDENQLKHMIRAHEVPHMGYQFNFNNSKLLTIFSSSHYCGNNNQSACILIDQKSIRILSFDTYNLF